MKYTTSQTALIHSFEEGRVTHILLACYMFLIQQLTQLFLLFHFVALRIVDFVAAFLSPSSIVKQVHIYVPLFDSACLALPFLHQEDVQYWVFLL
jgi:hypothetical protein